MGSIKGEKEAPNWPQYHALGPKFMLKGLKNAQNCPTLHDVEPYRPLWAQKLDKLAPNWPKLAQIQEGAEGVVKKPSLPEVLTYLPII